MPAPTSHWSTRPSRASRASTKRRVPDKKKGRRSQDRRPFSHPKPLPFSGEIGGASKSRRDRSRIAVGRDNPVPRLAPAAHRPLQAHKDRPSSDDKPWRAARPTASSLHGTGVPRVTRRQSPSAAHLRSAEAALFASAVSNRLFRRSVQHTRTYPYRVETGILSPLRYRIGGVSQRFYRLDRNPVNRSIRVYGMEPHSVPAEREWDL